MGAALTIEDDPIQRLADGVVGCSSEARSTASFQKPMMPRCRDADGVSEAVGQLGRRGSSGVRSWVGCDAEGPAPSVDAEVGDTGGTSPYLAAQAFRYQGDSEVAQRVGAAADDQLAVAGDDPPGAAADVQHIVVEEATIGFRQGRDGNDLACIETGQRCIHQIMHVHQDGGVETFDAAPRTVPDLGARRARKHGLNADAMRAAFCV